MYENKIKGLKWNLKKVRRTVLHFSQKYFSHMKILIKTFFFYVRIFFSLVNCIFNSNFLTKLNYKPELNKFETLENQLNKVKLED